MFKIIRGPGRDQSGSGFRLRFRVVLRIYGAMKRVWVLAGREDEYLRDALDLQFSGLKVSCLDGAWSNLCW